MSDLVGKTIADADSIANSFIIRFSDGTELLVRHVVSYADNRVTRKLTITFEGKEIWHSQDDLQ